jgi:UDP-hydrolysing UDP-N-acetyl-D-glucosamine 2-epimerase
LRKIAVVTVARSDYGIYRPILKRIQEEPSLTLQIIAAGAHLAPTHGLTIRDIQKDGFPIADQVDMLLQSDTPEAIATSMGLGTIGFSRAYSRLRPDIVLLLGDRFEMHAAAVAALPLKVPVAHIHGGELTMGAFDDSLRHSITKLSHLHFVATKDYGRRVRQLGEEPWRVTVSGAPALDNITSLPPLSRTDLEIKYGLQLDAPPLLVTFHPITLEYEHTEWQVTELLSALEVCGLPVIFTMPNADTHRHLIAEAIQSFVKTNPRASVFDSLGTQAYFSVMAVAAAMVGNSSSGIIEAPSFRLPVVNIGLRQAGRTRAMNVIDVGHGRDEILAGIRRAIDPRFRAQLENMENPYKVGNASQAIVDRLKSVQIDDSLLMKRFHDVCEEGARVSHA